MHALRAIGLCQCFNGALEFQAGHWHAAEAALDEAIQLYRQIGTASGEALSCQRLGRLLTAQGRLDKALDVLNEGVAAAERALMRAHCLTRLYATITRNRLQAGDLPTAEQALSLGLATSARHGHCSTCDSLLLPAAISVQISAGNLDEAASFFERLEHAAARYGSRTWLAMACQARGELAAARGDVEAALADYTEAHERFNAANYPYEAARCLAELARLYQQRGLPQDADRARTAEQEAKTLFQQLMAS